MGQESRQIEAGRERKETIKKVCIIDMDKHVVLNIFF